MIEHFDEQAFEREIAELSKAVEQKSLPEAPKEAIRSVIGEHLYQGGTERMGAGMPTPSPAPATGPLPSYAADIPAEARLRAEKLLESVFHKGIMHSIREVRKADPLTMDLFHDAITERLYEEFKKRKLIRS